MSTSRLPAAAAAAAAALAPPTPLDGPVATPVPDSAYREHWNACDARCMRHRDRIAALTAAERAMRALGAAEDAPVEHGVVTAAEPVVTRQLRAERQSLQEALREFLLLTALMNYDPYGYLLCDDGDVRFAMDVVAAAGPNRTREVVEIVRRSLDAASDVAERYIRQDDGRSAEATRLLREAVRRAVMEGERAGVAFLFCLDPWVASHVAQFGDDDMKRRAGQFYGGAEKSEKQA